MPSSPRSIEATSQNRGSISRSPFSSSFLSASPLAQESIERDIAECSDDDAVTIEEDYDQVSSSDEESGVSTVRRTGSPSHSMANSYRRPSFVAFGGSRLTCAPQSDVTFLTKREKYQARKEERRLLRDNNLAPPKHPKGSIFARLHHKLFHTKQSKSDRHGEMDHSIFAAGPS